MSDTFRLIRNATIVLEYGGKKFLIDPVFAPKSADANGVPSVDLPVSIAEILEGIDAILLTCLVPEHLDAAAIAAIPKGQLIYAQNAEDQASLTAQGFTKVEVLGEESTSLGNDVTLKRVTCLRDPQDAAGAPSQPWPITSFLFQHPKSKSLYLVADSIWCAVAQQAVEKFQPDYVVLNAGDATVHSAHSIAVGKEILTHALATLPEAIAIVHQLEAAGRQQLTRQQLGVYAKDANIASRTFIPADGEFILIH